MNTLPRDIHITIFKLFTLWPTSDRPDVLTLGRLASTCKYFCAIININSPNSPFVHSREKSRRLRCIRMRQLNPINMILCRHKISCLEPLNCCKTVYQHITYEVFMEHYKTVPMVSEITESPNISIEMLMEFASSFGYTYKNMTFNITNTSFITQNELLRNGFGVYTIIATNMQHNLSYEHDRWAYAMYGKINPKDIEIDPSKWRYEHLVNNYNIPAEKLLEWREKWNEGFSIQELSRFINSPKYRTKYEQIIVESFDKLTDEDIFIISGHFSLETIVAHSHYPWRWGAITRFLNSSELKIILDNPHLPWVYDNFQLIAYNVEFSTRVKYHQMYIDNTLTLQIIKDAIKQHAQIKWSWAKHLAKYQHIDLQELIDLAIILDKNDAVDKSNTIIHEDVFMYETDADIQQHSGELILFAATLSHRNDITLQIVLNNINVIPWYYSIIFDKLMRPYYDDFPL